MPIARWSVLLVTVAMALEQAHSQSTAQLLWGAGSASRRLWTHVLRLRRAAMSSIRGGAEVTEYKEVREGNWMNHIVHVPFC